MKLDKSFEYLSRAEKVIPVCSQTFSKGYRYFPKGVSPIFLSCGQGSHTWDVDGNEYVDYICGLGPITLGYNYYRVNQAIIDQLLGGIIYSLPHPLEVELAELLVDIIPSAEMVRFFKTGSEACQAAIRVARAYTGRDGIAFRGYHGWHDWYAVHTERNRGIPRPILSYIYEFEYNDIKSLEQLLKSGMIAAVIMEPVIVEPPKDGFLQQVKELTHQYGAILIFDEVVTGFRWALGGAQEYFGVIPDLAVFGKGLGNGMPINAVVGRRDIMLEFEEVMVSSTFGGECLSLVAGLATIQEMRDKKTIDHCWKLGTELMAGLMDIGIEVQGYPCRPAITQAFSLEEKALFLQEIIRRGILIHSGFLINFCYSHTDEDIDRTIEACGEAMDIVRKTVSSGNWDVLEGELIIPAFKRL